MKKIIITGIYLIIGVVLSAQSELDNGSFEEVVQNNQGLKFWSTCNRGATPDILPGNWEVNNPAFDGDHYAGLITRKDGTWESIGQQLSQPVAVNECQTLQMMLARSNAYANFNLPIQLKVFLGNSACDKALLIGQSTNVIETEWQEFVLSFRPKVAYSYIILEAYYGNGIYFNYNGNILIDKVSNIKICPRA